MGYKIDVKRKLLKVQRVVGEATKRDTIKNHVKLPVKAIKIFDIVATLADVRGQAKEGGVHVTGTVHKQVFFVDSGDLVRHVAEDVPFRIFVDVPGATSKMNVQVRAKIVDIERRLIAEGKKIEQDIIIEIFVKVTVTDQIEVVTDVIGPGIRVKKELLRVESVIGEDEKTETLVRTAKLPITAAKIFKIIARVRDVATEIKENLVIVKGVVHKQIFLVDEGDLVRHHAEDIPFSMSVEIPGAKPDMVAQVDVDAIVDQFELLEVPGKKLKQIIILEVFVKVADPIQLEIVADVKGSDIEVKKKLLKVESVVTDVIAKKTVEAKVALPVGAKKIFEIIGTITDVKTKIADDKVIINAVLHKQIFFVDEGDLLRHHREDVPFTIVVNAPGAKSEHNVHVNLRIIGEIERRLVGKKIVEQAAIIEAFVKVTKDVQLEVVIDVIIMKPPRPPKPPEHPKKEYIVKKGDTMYKIAKRFGVTLDALIAANPQIKDPNQIFPGDKIFIPKR